MFLVKSGCYYVKAIAGRPVFRSTQSLADAARFDDADAARDFATNVFGAAMLAALEIVEERSEVRPENGDVAARNDSRRGWSRLDRFQDEPNMPWDHYMGR